jgi:PAS domain S-box-containing protein
MWIFDCETLEMSSVNEAALRQYGYSRDEFLALSALDVRPPEEAPRFVDRIPPDSNEYAPCGVWRHLRKDGTLLFAEICAFRFDREGRPCELVLAQDVTARVQAEEALHQSEAALKAMVENAPFGICSTSLRNDCFETFNPAMAEMLGYSHDEMRALRISTQVYAEPNGRERMIEVLRRVRNLNGYEATLLRKNGTPVRIRAWGLLKDQTEEEPDRLNIYVQDITEHSSLEQQIRQVQKLEAVGRLAGGIAHDFNNILVVIRLSTELMLGQVTLDSPLSKPLIQVLNASERAAALTRQLLAFGRQQVMQSRTINLNAVVVDTLHLLRRTIGEDIKLETQLSDDLQNTRLDPDQLAQVIMNLAINARDAMPDGGTLQIETQNVELDSNYAKAHEPVHPGKYVMLAVSDTGTGIDKTIVPRIFDPFFTTKDVGKGTGLGLSIVYGIVKQSGGYIWVYSEPGHGTTFKLYFPVTSAQPAPALPVNEITAPAAESTVLIVEDEAAIRNNLRECLRQLGYKVMEAADGVEALEVFRQNQKQIDLVLTDLVMPLMGGHELALKLASVDPSVTVVFMSGYTEDKARQRENIQRGNIFLTKPFSVADLSSAVHRALALRAVGAAPTVH